MSAQLNQNTITIESILSQVNALPNSDTGLPTLSNPGSADDLLLGKELIDGSGNIITGTIETKDLSTPEIDINDEGLISASVIQDAGYTVGGIASNTLQLTTQASNTITPSKSEQTAVPSGVYTTGDIIVEAIPDNYIEPSGSLEITENGSHDVKQYESINVNVTSSENTDLEDGFVTRTFTGEYNNSRVTTIGSYAFYGCTSLQSVNFPLVTSISNYAFVGCTSLQSVSFPAATNIGTSAFGACSSLQSVTFPLVTSISNYAFSGCTSLHTVIFPLVTSLPFAAFEHTALQNIYLPKITRIGNYAFAYCTLQAASFSKVTNIAEAAFRYCSSLQSVSFPLVSIIGSYAFASCPRLQSVYFPIASQIGSYAFASCATLQSVIFHLASVIYSCAFLSCISLQKISMPKAKTIQSQAFRYCKSLQSVSFPVAANIGNSAFANCTTLSELYLASTTVCTLANSNAFSTTLICSDKGSIFVPESLVESYKSATNWAFFSTQIFSYSF